METIIKINKKEGTVKLEGDKFPISDSFILTVLRVLLGTRKEKKLESLEKIDIPSTYNIETEIKKLEDSDKRFDNIVALYWSYKKPLLTKGTYGGEISRSRLAAKKLIDYTDKRLVETMEWMDRSLDFKWNLDTVVNYIKEDLSKIRGRK